jgi:CheY-like chemotaxis protein
MPKVALVVDDSMLVRYTVCRFLQDRGFAVEAAANGKEALKVLERVQPDLIVTDMQMPQMSGSELITVLKSKPQTSNVPIIVVTGRASGFTEGDRRANFSISKDIDVDTQLEKALAVIDGTGTESARKQAAGK